MVDRETTKEELLDELAQLRQRVQELEQREKQYRQQEQALREREEWARLAIQVGRLGGWRLCLDTNCVEIDQRMREIWGEPEDTVLIPLPKVLERIHPDDRERVAAAVNAAIDPQSSGTYEIEYRLVWKDGTERWVLANGQAQFEGEGGSRRTVNFFGTALDITDRKQMETALIAQEQRYRYIFEAVGVSIWEEDFSEVKAAIDQLKTSGVQDFRQYFTEHPEFVQRAVEMVRLRDVNQASLLLFGAQTKAELLHSLPQIFTPETREAFIEELLAIATGRTQFATETVLQTLQGQQLQVWFSITFPPPSESYERVIVSLLDITERKQTEKALKRYQLLSEHSRDIVLYIRRDGQILEANQAAVNAYGYSRAELLSRTISDLRSPETYSSLNAQFSQAYQRGILFETVHRRQDGSSFPVEVSAQSTVTETEAVILSIIRDISERKQVEAEREYLLRCEQSARLAAESAERRAQFIAEAGTVLNSSLEYQSTLRSVAQLVVPTLADWCAVDILNAGGSLERLATAHIDPAKVEWGIELHRRYPPDLNAPHGIAQVLRTGQPEYYPEISEEQLIAGARDAEHLQILRALGLKSVMIVPLIVRGRTLGVISFISAESGHSYSLADLSLAEELARRAALALDNAYLYLEAQQAQLQAEAANRMKDEFLAVLSHELRTPMNPILGWARLLQKGTLDAERTATALATIERNAQLQVQLIEDLLDIARILQGKFSLNPYPVNLASTIEAAIETVRLAAESKNIQIQAQFEANMGSVLGDAGRLQQVVWNLLSNALKFTPTGGQVEIQLTKIGSQAQIQVRDTGKGIKPEFLPYVFDTFRQADSSTTRTFGGLGLGLAIVRHIVELHGGSVKAESLGEGQGAIFTVQLPLLSEASPEIKTKTAPQPALALAGLRVLVVDDEADTLELSQFILETAGAIVIPAVSAANALQQFEQAQPDVLVSDIGMPQMDGYTLISQIRSQLPEGKQIPAIALTAYAGEINQQQVLAAGFQLHLVKPVEPEQLVEAIAQVLPDDA
ncbi:PAS domain S-box protein [Cyanobacteria bacterium FACHB-DQ100]|nr:PAS domain S-box protein [Cyanobacteria bacterium FACHB-DQ100]